MKKRLLAILIVVALVFSSIALLVACDETEYKVSFKNMGRTIFTLTTTKGKLDKAKVEAEQAKVANILKARESTGYFFTTWYTTETKDEDGASVYSGEINYAKVYTANAEYVAGYEYAPLEGEEEGYTLVGVVGNVEDWGGDGGMNVTHTEWQLQQHSPEGWMYSVEDINLLPGDSFKVKTIGLGWDDGKVKIGYDRVNQITLDDGVEATALKEHELMGELILGSDDGSGGLNIHVSQWVETMTVNIVLNFRTKKIDIIVTAIEVRDELPATEWILTGNFSEDNWSSSTTEPTLIFTDLQDGTYTISHAFVVGSMWRIRTNTAGWGGEQFGYTHLGTPTKGANVQDEIPSDLFAAGDSDNNIVVKYACTLKITLDPAAKTIEIEVTSITIPESQDLTYIIVGSWGQEGDSDYWNFENTNTDFHFQPTQERGIYEITIDLSQGQEFCVSATPGGYAIYQIGSGALNSVTKVPSVTEDVTNLFTGNKGDMKGNITATKPCNVSIVLNVNTSKIDIVVNSVGEEQALQWFLAGNFAGNSWNAGTIEDGYGMTAVPGQSGKFEITIRLTAGTEWQVVAIPGGWSNQHGFGTLAPDGITKEDSITDDVTTWFTGTPGDVKGNISVSTTCTVKITLDTTTDLITIHVISKG